jgi:hypothetical protein
MVSCTRTAAFCDWNGVVHFSLLRSFCPAKSLLDITSMCCFSMHHSNDTVLQRERVHFPTSSLGNSVILLTGRQTVPLHCVQLLICFHLWARALFWASRYPGNHLTAFSVHAGEKECLYPLNSSGCVACSKITDLEHECQCLLGPCGPFDARCTSVPTGPT